MIKKYSKQPQADLSLANRLTAYARQARQYRNQPHQTLSSLDWKKTTLAALIPLAAASAAQAQCQGPTSPIMLGGGQQFLLDVDNNGVNDIKFNVVAAATIYGGSTLNWYIAKVNPTFYIGTAPRANGQLITRGNASFGGGPGALCRDGGLGNFCGPVNKTLAVRKGNNTTGQPGWMTIASAGNNGSNYTFTITERGVAVPGDNAAIVGTCSTLTDGGVPLPIELTGFTAEAQAKHITLNWATATELHNSGFEVQRSTNAQNFVKIGWVAGLGTKSEGQQYAFTDIEVQPNTNYYYRLRQLDQDGTEHFTPVRMAMVKDNSRLTLEQMFPNPVSRGYGLAMFRANVPQEGDVDIQLFDARGSLVKQLIQPLSAGTNNFSVPVADIETGTYFAKLQMGKEVIYHRLVVAN